ncbi:ribosomal L1 domain-containing protein 1-like [Microplitis mediator]|uniref:ribosomal L1 domain-containing protein 1-like n=1 Tax=Microplitis mediator TaxID=375433 RepID=UPI00255439F0|nr:ribosomal L1 domain-containing protein 1-like [Microplitis mediator]
MKMKKEGIKINKEKEVKENVVEVKSAKNKKPVGKINKSVKQNKESTGDLKKTKSQSIKFEDLKNKIEASLEKSEKKLQNKQTKRKLEVPEVAVKKLKKSEEKIGQVKKVVEQKNVQVKKTDKKKVVQVKTEVPKKTEEKIAPVGKKSKKTNQQKINRIDKKLKLNEEQINDVDKKLKLNAEKMKVSEKKTKSDAKKLKQEDKKKKSNKKLAKGVKIEVDGEEKIVNDLEINRPHVSQAVDGILQLAEQEKSGKTLFSSDDNPIFLQINCIKIPKVPHRRLRITLPHDMVGPTDDIALFVGDLGKGRRQDYEKTIEHWETKLNEKGVTRIKEIIPMAKVKAEYRQFETKRKLSRLFDFFLIDGKIAGHMTHLLGTTFTRAGKPPTPVKLWRDNLKQEFDFALRKTCMDIHGHGGTHSVRVGTISMPQKKIVDNILAACEALEKLYPGGFNNIRSIGIKTRKSLAIPIYYTMKDKNEVQVPVVQPLRPKAYKTVTGELSTIEDDDVEVAVTPRGNVKFIKKSTQEIIPEPGVKTQEPKTKKGKLNKIKNKPALKNTKAKDKKIKNKSLEKKIKVKKIK